MPFVKLDTGILKSTIWFDRVAREVFITALLMAEPYEFETAMEQLEVDDLRPTGFMVPPGWYGLVRAAGPGIVHTSGVEREEGMAALKRLCAREPETRSKDFEGRRMARVDGGYLILNYMKYRERDYTAAERMRRLRLRQKVRGVTRNVTPDTRNDRNALRKNVTPLRNVTHADTEADTEEESKTVGTTSSEGQTNTAGGGNNKGASAFVLPAWVPIEAWNGFVEMRRKIRKPMTDNAKRILIRKLGAISDDPTAVLEQSTANAWASVWPLQEAKSNGETTNQRHIREFREIIREADDRSRDLPPGKV